MRGDQALIAARLRGIQLHRIDVEVLAAEPANRNGWTPPGLDTEDGQWLGRIEIYASDNLRTLDMRCCHGAAVRVIADSYAIGWPVVERIAEAEPARITFASPEMAALYTPDQGLQAWDM